MSQHEQFMRRAIELSRYAAITKKSGGVFGAVIVKDGQIIAEGYNQVLLTHDPTWHAEMHAIREASKKLATPHLTGCTLYTSSEPCPMCLGACYWAHIDAIYYASTVEDAMTYGNFQDITIYEDLKKKPEDRQIVAKELMRLEACQVWKEFASMPDRGHY